MTGSDPGNAPPFFAGQMAVSYDRKNSGLKPISDCLHFVLGIVLQRLPEEAKVLSIGVGTGVEIIALARIFPRWTFTGVDPSADMLAIARHRLDDAGLSNRCTLVEGHVADVEAGPFDAAISLFVAHFVAREDRPAFYRHIFDRLRPGGVFASAEIAGDFGHPTYPEVLADWTGVQTIMAGSRKSTGEIDATLRSALAVMSGQETAQLWRNAGFTDPVAFFQASLIRGWYAQRPQVREKTC